MPRCIDRIDHIGPIATYFFFPALFKVSLLPRKPLFHKLPCMNFIVLSEPCVVLRSDSPKPWHPPESGVRLKIKSVFPLKTWEAVS